MAERRMFSNAIVDNDMFLDMPITTQLLYFHLGMHTDDEGFVSSPRKIQRSVGCSNDDMKVLISKGFIIPFESGVIVVTHWHIHNSLRKDRAKETIYKDERERLTITDNGAYCLTDNELSTGCPTLDNQMTTNCPHKLREDKISEDKESEGKGTQSPDGEEMPPKTQKPAFHLYGEYKHIRLTNEQYSKLIEEYGEKMTAEYIKRCDEYCQQYGKSYKDYNLTLRNWIRKDSEKNGQAKQHDEFAGKYSGTVI